MRILGRIGWCAKGLVYGLLGGMCCDSAVGDDDSSVSPQVCYGVPMHCLHCDAYPTLSRYLADAARQVAHFSDVPGCQGAFILVGSNTIGIPLLVVMAVALITYCIWRFWEAVTGQGADAAFGNLKNFFRYRLSPFVSGIVYALYTIFVITLIPKSQTERRGSGSSSFPDSWSHSTAGKVGLCFAGIAFLAGSAHVLYPLIPSPALLLASKLMHCLCCQNLQAFCLYHASMHLGLQNCWCAIALSIATLR